MRVLLPLLLLGLAGCYMPRSTGADPYPGNAYGGLYHEPLRASLWMDPYTSHASFELNRPAHVAIFMWQPGQHLTMLHPDIGYHGRQHFVAGRHNLWTRTGQHYATRRPASARYMGGLQPMVGPTYYMLIASDEPLHVAHFYGTARMGWAHQVSWSHNLYTATELLATQIVPDLERTEWTVAYHMAWHDDAQRLGVPTRQAFRHYRWVSCPGGIVISVPLDVWASGLFACPEVDPVEPAPAAEPGTRTAVVPRRPLPPESMEGERADEAEFRNLLERIHAARGKPTDDVEAPPVPAWRTVERGAAAAAPVARASRPLIRPAVPKRPAPEVRRPMPGATQPSPWRSPRGARQGTRADSPHGARPARDAATPAAGAQRPSPRAERATPRVQRPPPQTQRATPPPARPRPTPAPDNSEG
jgi:hypothetical protein